jgi:hypothetical protein
VELNPASGERYDRTEGNKYPIQKSHDVPVPQRRRFES